MARPSILPDILTQRILDIVLGTAGTASIGGRTARLVLTIVAAVCGAALIEVYLHVVCCTGTSSLNSRMLGHNLVARIAVSLSLVICTHIRSVLSRQMDNDSVLKVTVGSTILLAVLESSMPKNESMYTGIVSIIRGLCILIFAQVMLESFQPVTLQPSSSTSPGRAGSVLLDMKLAPRSENVFISFIPPSMIAPVEAFVVSSILVVGIAFAAEQVSLSVAKNKKVPELDRLLMSVQWLFADTVAELLIDKVSSLPLHFGIWYVSIR